MKPKKCGSVSDLLGPRQHALASMLIQDDHTEKTTVRTMGKSQISCDNQEREHQTFSAVI